MGDLRRKYHKAQEGWINRHTWVRFLRNKFLWAEYHVNRGKGFFSSWIDFAKNLFYLFIIAELAPKSEIVNSFPFPHLILLFTGWIRTHPLEIILLSLVFFVVWSQIMDFLHYSQAQAEFSNVRNYFQEEVRQFISEVRKYFKIKS